MAFFEAAYAAAAHPMRLVEADPELLGEAGARHPMAGRELELVRLETGRWADGGAAMRPSLGFLVVEGLLARRVALGPQRRAELLGAGDVVRPWERDEELGFAGHDVAWDVLAPARLAVLDATFVGSAAAAPDVLARLAVRSVQRARRIALQLAITDVRHIDQRLLALFGHLGDRWGRVTTQGIHLPVRMTHELIAELAGAKRPTVTTALGSLERAGSLARLPDRTWLLRVPADDLLAAAGGLSAPGP